MLNDTVVDKDIDFSPNFKIYRQDSHTNSGGICTWIRSDIPHQRMPHLEIKSNVYHIENFIFELTIKKEKWHVFLFTKT